MRFTVCMKTPDALDYAIDEAAECEEDENGDLVVDVDEVAKLCRKWFKDGETVWLDIDTDEMTCTVQAL